MSLSHNQPAETTANAPAFPSVYACRIGRDVRRGDFIEKDLLSDGGMSLRTYVATAALQGILATDVDGSHKDAGSEVASDAVGYADALLAKLSTPQPAAVDVSALIVANENLAAFKAYVHRRLDDAGVPADPDSPHKAEGCRIGGRLDIVLAGYAASEVNAELVEAAQGLLNVIFDTAREEPDRHRIVSIVNGKPEYAAIDRLRAALAPASSSAIATDVNTELVEAAQQARDFFNDISVEGEYVRGLTRNADRVMASLRASLARASPSTS